jgi:hypothetical protein
MRQAIERDAMSTDNGRRNSAAWVDDGDKYAVIALSAKLGDTVPLQEMTPNHWAFADERFEMPPHWREWLGTIRTGEVEGTNLFLLSKMQSQTPDMEAELKRRIRSSPGTIVGCGTDN